MQGEHHGVTRHEVVGHILDLVGEDVRRGHFHGCRQVDDHRMFRRRLDDVDHRVAHLDCVLRLGAGEGFRRILVVQVDALGFALELLAQGGRVGGELLDAGLVLAEHDLALQHGHGIVEVHDGALGALQTLVSLANQVLTGLGEHDDGDVIRNELALDQHADEVVIGFGSRREADLDLLEAHRHEQVPETQLALGIHRVDEAWLRREDRRSTNAVHAAVACPATYAPGNQTAPAYRMRRTCCTASCWAFAELQCNAPEAAAGRCSLRWTPRRLPRDQTLTIDPDPSLLLICKVDRPSANPHCYVHVTYLHCRPY